MIDAAALRCPRLWPPGTLGHTEVTKATLGPALRTTPVTDFSYAVKFFSSSSVETAKEEEEANLKDELVLAFLAPADGDRNESPPRRQSEKAKSDRIFIDITVGEIEWETVVSV